MGNSAIALAGEKTRFGPDNPPPQGGRKIGSKSRKTIFREWLELETECKGLGGEVLNLSQADQIAIKMIVKAKKGDVQAAYFVFDSAYGKLTNRIETDSPIKQAFDVSKLSTDELLTLQALYAKGSGKNDHIQEAEIID